MAIYISVINRERMPRVDSSLIVSSNFFLNSCIETNGIDS